MDDFDFNAMRDADFYKAQADRLTRGLTSLFDFIEETSGDVMTAEDFRCPHFRRLAMAIGWQRSLSPREVLNGELPRR